MSTLSGQRVVVFGLGVSGRAAARLAVAQGADVLGVDSRAQLDPIEGVTLRLGEAQLEDFTTADLVIVSPGIPAAHPVLVAAAEQGVPLIGELAFAARYATVPIVAITGTNGKSTVTWFTHQLLEAAGLRTFVGGNLGQAVSTAVGQDVDVWVLEVSSYQLELATGFRPRVGVVLNLTPDHLARHGNMDGYARAKTDLFQAMTPDDLAILPQGDERLAHAALRHPGARRAWLGDLPGVVRRGNEVTIGISDERISLSLDALRPLGDHNKDNAAAAALLAIAAGADPERVADAIATLTGLPHRMEVVAELKGVRIINDSKATNIDAARTGLRALDRPAVVLLGGESKGPGFAELKPLLKGQRGIVAFGGDGPEIAQELMDAGLDVTLVGSMDEALAVALALAEPGDAVLLSPGCASFDAYANFAQRGDVFRSLATARLDTEETA